MANGGRHDPHVTANFQVEIDGITVAQFTECFGLASETDVIVYREGGDSGLRLLPGLTRYPPIMLKRGIVLDRSLWEWRKRVIEGQVDRRSGHIVLLDAQRAPVARWTFREGWPSKWIGPHLDARSSAVAIETLEIVHERLDWES